MSNVIPLRRRLPQTFDEFVAVIDQEGRKPIVSSFFVPLDDNAFSPKDPDTRTPIVVHDQDDLNKSVATALRSLYLMHLTSDQKVANVEDARFRAHLAAIDGALYGFEADAPSTPQEAPMP